MAKQYIVDGNLTHDRQPYKTGDKVMLEDDQAAQLLAIGRVKLDDVQPEATSTPVTGDKPDDFPERKDDMPTTDQMTAMKTSASETMDADRVDTHITTTPAVAGTTDVQPVTQPTTLPPAAPQTHPANPTPEQIDKDMARLG